MTEDLAALARIAREVASDWGCGLGPPYPLARHSYVAPAGEAAVIKVRPAGDDESVHEADALELWDGNGAVRLLRSDPERRAMLIERADGDIAGLAEAEATAIAVDVGTRLWRAAASPFRWLGDHVPRWLENAERAGETGSELMPLARELFERLDPGREILVHGDLHHHNILDAGGRFAAIDPKPMLGEPEFDVASFLWNPIGYRLDLEVSEGRLAAFAAAGLDQWRMRAWAVIRAAYLGADPAEVAVLRELVRCRA